MDKGAHFYKCDFQVHTPRDANWDGAEAATPKERKAYAEELIQACRAKGLSFKSTPSYAVGCTCLVKSRGNVLSMRALSNTATKTVV